jgi:CubicO group peptidase (beta-lactamase class C family)
VYGPNPDSFGHSGWGGSFAFGDPANGLGVAYTMNQMGTDLVGDPRSMALIDALYASLNN